MLVNWKEAQQKAAWAVTMAKVLYSTGCITDTLAARHVLVESC